MITNNPTTSKIWKKKEKKNPPQKWEKMILKIARFYVLGFQCVSINIKGYKRLKICTSYPGFAAYLAKSSLAW